MSGIKKPVSKNQVRLNVKEALKRSARFKKIFNDRYSKEGTFEEYLQDYVDSFMEGYYKVLRKNKKIYGIVHKVSSNGMNRTASFYQVIGKDITRFNHYLSLINDTPTNPEGVLRLSGCGMDILFNEVYNFSRTVFGDGYTIKSENM